MSRAATRPRPRHGVARSAGSADARKARPARSPCPKEERDGAAGSVARPGMMPRRPSADPADVRVAHDGRVVHLKPPTHLRSSLPGPADRSADRRPSSSPSAGTNPSGLASLRRHGKLLPLACTKSGVVPAVRCTRSPRRRLCRRSRRRDRSRDRDAERDGVEGAERRRPVRGVPVHGLRRVARGRGRLIRRGQRQLARGVKVEHAPSLEFRGHSLFLKSCCS